jgi:hypothetical protein
MTTPVLIVDIFKDIVSKVDTALYPTLGKHIFYQYGSSLQILDKLVQMNNGIASKGQRFPLVALFQPFSEGHGTDGYYTDLSIPKIVIATLTNGSDNVSTRYDLTFKPLLYPIYYELLNQIALSNWVVDQDPKMIEHTKVDNPGSPPPKGTSFDEFVDAIEIYNLKTLIIDGRTCKTL